MFPIIFTQVTACSIQTANIAMATGWCKIDCVHWLQAQPFFLIITICTFMKLVNIKCEVTLVDTRNPVNTQQPKTRYYSHHAVTITVTWLHHNHCSCPSIRLSHHFFPHRTANMSWRTCVVVKQIQSNQLLPSGASLQLQGYLIPLCKPALFTATWKCPITTRCQEILTVDSLRPSKAV